jgi:hypothetical protein
MRNYVAIIARFFGSAALAIKLLEDREYDILSAEATLWYYDSIQIYPVEGKVDAT